MKCRKCKYFIAEGDTEYYIVHLAEAHGIRLEDSLKKQPLADKKFVEELWRLHKKTGERSKEKKFPKQFT